MLKRLLPLIILVLTACSQAPTPINEPSSNPAQTLKNPRPEGSPDVFIFAFAGRCGFASIGCKPGLEFAPEDNKAYLDDADTLSYQAVEEAFKNSGYVVQGENYRANLSDHQNIVYGDGYLSAQEELNWIKENWIRDFDNPTRLVLMAHSHGNQFASLLAINNDDVQFDYFIYLDGVCTHWDIDHLGAIPAIHNRFQKVYGTKNNYPFPLNQPEVNSACNAWNIPSPGKSLGIKDVTPDNVWVALEVQSGGLANLGLTIKDTQDNVRFDGKTTNIFTIRERDVNEGHSEVTKKGSKGMNWVVKAIEENKLPSYGLQAQSTFQIPEAPEGWDYSQR
jgi:hypothetical protein